MKRAFMAVFLMVLLVGQIVAVSALSASEFREEWRDLKKISADKRQAHREAKIDYAADKTDENNQAVIDTGKESLHAALNEAEAWLKWKEAQAERDDEAPDELKDAILEDIAANLAKIDELRTDVDGVENRIGLGLVWLKMIGKYVELITDVSRNTGKALVFRAEQRMYKVEEFESKLREAADGDDDALAFLDVAKEDLEEAQENIDKAEASYEMVRMGGTPLIKHREGNNYLRVARANMLSAHANLRKAFREIGDAS